MAKYNYVLVACARWETDCIVEWICYHRWLGFDHLYLYCNDDDPAELYRAVLPFLIGPSPYVTFHTCRYLGQQKAMYLHYLKTYKDQTDWFMFLDIDEFLRLPVHRDVGSFVSAYSDVADSIYLNWCFFGNSGFDDRPPGSVLLNYTRRAATAHNLMTKVVTRSSAIDLARLRLGPMSDFWHYWNSSEDFRSLRLVNVLGEPMHHYYDDLDKSFAHVKDPPYFDRLLRTAIINHYAFKSRQDFLRRAARGMAGPFAQQIAYRKHHETGQADRILKVMNEVEDRFLHDLWAKATTPAPAAAVIALPPWPNVAHGKPACQSSVYQGADAVADAAAAGGAVNGRIDGTRKFHTDIEDAPWWQVDLLGYCTIHEIHIYNTTDEVAHRFRRFSLAISIDAESWVELARKEDDAIVGALDTAPFVWRGPGTAWGRFLRVTLLDRNWLHFDQVEVFGVLPA